MRAFSRGAAFVGSALAFVIVLAAGRAAAQAAKGSPQGPARSSSQFTLNRGEAGGADAQIARSRARAGDCAGALPAFDAAIRATIEPTLRRDRGLCHEKLNHPYPAMDDYRAYLTAQPDAPDAEQIRQRLAALEEQAGVGGPSSQQVKEESAPSEGAYEASASMSFGSGGAKASASSSGSARSSSSRVSPDSATEPGRSYDYYAAQERKADEAEASPLRYGAGAVLGPFFHFPRFFVGEGANDDVAYGVGAAFRWATNQTLSLISEIGYAGVGTQGANTSASGPLLMAGVEIRLPITRFASDQVILRGGFGFERYVTSGTRIATNAYVGRFGAGFRHVFGPSLAFEILADGGPVLADPELDGLDSRFIGVIGGSTALLVGF